MSKLKILIQNINNTFNINVVFAHLMCWGLDNISEKNLDIKFIVDEKIYAQNEKEHLLDKYCYSIFTDEELDYVFNEPENRKYERIQKLYNFDIELQQQKRFEKVILEKLGDWQPDIILSMFLEPSAMLFKNIYPNALYLNNENALFCRPPFPRFLTYDTNNFLDTFFVKYADDIKNLEISDEENVLINNFKSNLKQIVSENNLLTDVINDYKRKFRKTILCPLVGNYGTKLFAKATFLDEVELLKHIFNTLPKDIGVFVTEHDKDSIFDAETLKYFQENYENFIFLKLANLKRYASNSLSYFEHVDAVINTTSKTGYLATFWDKPIISFAKNYNDLIKDLDGLEDIESLWNLPSKNKNNIIAWYISNYIVSVDKITKEKDYFWNYLNNKLEKYRKTCDINFEYMDKINDLEETLKYILEEIKIFYSKDKDIEQKIVLANKNLKYFSDNLAIFLITYNRKDYMRRTLDSLISKVSPFRDCDITVLDNASTDGSSELIDIYCQMKSNIHHIRHKVNIGGNGNITRGFELGATCDKEYFWVICDDDKFDFSNASELVEKMRDKKDVICVSDYCIQPDENYNASIEDALIQLTFVPAGIYKKSLMDGDIFTNMNHSIYTMFPQLCAPIHAVNKYGEDSISVLSSPIVFNGLHCDDPCRDFSYVIGLDDKELIKFHEDVSWILGFANAITLLKDKNLQKLVVEKAITNSETYGNLENFYFAMFNTYLHLDKFYRLFEIFRLLPSIYTLTFLLKAIYWKLTFRNLRDKIIKYLKKLNKNTPIENAVYWASYFEKHNTQKYINKLAKKYKGKKILLYGNGIISKVIKENYDLSNLNIVAITDRKFLGCDIIPEKYQAVSPNKLKTIDFDVIFFFLKKRNAELIGKTLKKNGIKQEQYKFVRK